MSDNGEEIKTQPPQDIKLLITLTPDGQVTAIGPINNEPLSLWLLDKAKDIIKAHNFQLAQPKIAPAHGGILNFIRGRR